MKKIFDVKIIILLMFGFICIAPFKNQVKAQYFHDDSYRVDYLGFSPMVLFPEGVKKGNYDINVLPLVTTTILTGYIEARTTAFLNIGYRSEREDRNWIVSSMGGEMAFPIFFTPRIESYEASEGFYIAPGLRYLFIIEKERDKDKEYMYEFALFAEPGYSMRVFDEFSVSVGLQLGKKYMPVSSFLSHGTEREHHWLNYISLKLQFGIWI